MGYVGQTAVLPLNQAGFTNARDSKLEFQTALIDPTQNINFHEGGISKRGGTNPYLGTALSGTPAIRGLYDFRARGGTQYLLFSDANGNVYYNSESNVIKTGMSSSNRFHFSVFDNEVYISDGGSTPQVWAEGSASTSSVTAPTDWATNSDYPFQIIQHSRGSNARNWAITKRAVYASANADGDDMSDGNVKKIPVYSPSGLVGGFEFNGALFVVDKTKTYIIEDTDSDTSKWGYTEAIWEGGASHWRLIVKAANDVFMMSDEGFVYSIRAVQSSGDYEQVPLTRPAHIDRWFRENVTLTNIENFHAVYDRTLRAIKWFVQSGGSNTNTALIYFIDRPPELAWVIHENPDYSSGYNASISTERKKSDGTFKTYTGDFSGQIWELEYSTLSDNGSAYKGGLKTKQLDFGNPRLRKHFRAGRIRAESNTNSSLLVNIWIDGDKKSSESISIVGTGAKVGSAIVGTAVVASSTVEPYKFDLGYYGYDLQMEIYNETASNDFFLTELLIDFKPTGVR